MVDCILWQCCYVNHTTKWRIIMSGWTRQVVRMATIRIIVLSSCHSLCAMASTGQLHLPMLHDVTIANGLRNSCGNCPAHGCVVHPDAPSSLPSFNEETVPSLWNRPARYSWPSRMHDAICPMASITVAEVRQRRPTCRS